MNCSVIWALINSQNVDFWISALTNPTGQALDSAPMLTYHNYVIIVPYKDTEMLLGKADFYSVSL